MMMVAVRTAHADIWNTNTRLHNVEFTGQKKSRKIRAESRGLIVELQYSHPQVKGCNNFIDGLINQYKKVWHGAHF
jgi:hypothetical protein